MRKEWLRKAMLTTLHTSQSFEIRVWYCKFSAVFGINFFFLITESVPSLWTKHSRENVVALFELIRFASSHAFDRIWASAACSWYAMYLDGM